MTGKEVDEIIVGANGSVFTGVVGASLPATVATPLGNDFRDAGYVTEDGVGWTDSKNVKPIRAWQSFYDLRRIIESREGMLVFSLMQWSGGNVVFAFGGGEIIEPEAGFFTYKPPRPEEIDESMLVVEWEDGDFDFRLAFFRGMVTDKVDTKIMRTEAGLLPISFSLLGVTGSDPFHLQTNHPAFADMVGSGS